MRERKREEKRERDDRNEPDVVNLPTLYIPIDEDGMGARGWFYPDNSAMVLNHTDRDIVKRVLCTVAYNECDI